jgi:predicted DNA-binding protein YlxM (UPF0122 family)
MKMSAYPFGKEYSRRWLEGTIIAHIRNEYLGKTRPSLNQVIGVIKTVSKKLEYQEILSIIDETEQNQNILPTIPKHIKQRKMEEIRKQLKTVLG